MSYQVNNEEMGFLNKLADTLEEMQKEVLYLEVCTDDIPKATDRHPYTEDDEVEDYPFEFTYRGKSFEANASNNRQGFSLEISSSDEKFTKTLTFTMKESKETLVTVWKDLLAEIDQTIPSDKASKQFFDMWVQWQHFGSSIGSKASNMLYDALTKHIDPFVLEERLATRYKETERNYDWHLDSKLRQVTKIEVHGFLDNEWFIVLTENDVFLYQNRAEALDKYEEETLKKIGTVLHEELAKYTKKESA